jgi:hypothetical protein
MTSGDACASALRAARLCQLQPDSEKACSSRTSSTTMRPAPGSSPLSSPLQTSLTFQKVTRFTAALKVDGLRPLLSNRLIAETRYQHGTLQDTSGMNFVPKRNLTR